MKVRKNKQEDPRKKNGIRHYYGKGNRRIALPKANPYTPTPKELEELSPLMLQIKKKDAEMRMQKNKERIQAYEDSLTKAENSWYLIDKYDELIKKYNLEPNKSSEYDPFAFKLNPFSKTKTYDNKVVESFMSEYEPYETALLENGIDYEDVRLYTNLPFLSGGEYRNSFKIRKPKPFQDPRVRVEEYEVEDDKKTESTLKKTTKPIEKRPVEEKINLPYKSRGGEEKRDIKRRIEPAISKLSYNASGSKVFVEFSDGTKRTMTKPEFARWKKSSPVNEERVQKVRMSR